MLAHVLSDPRLSSFLLHVDSESPRRRATRAARSAAAPYTVRSTLVIRVAWVESPAAIGSASVARVKAAVAV